MLAMRHRKNRKAPAVATAPVVLRVPDPDGVLTAIVTAGRPAHPWTRPQKLLAAGLLLLGAVIAGPAFIVIFQTVTRLMDPWMGWWSWVVPVSGEIAFTFLFLNGLLLALRRAPSGTVRGLFMFLVLSGSTFLVAWASREAVPDMAGHLAVVDGFYGVLLAGKSTVMLLRGGKVRADRVSGGEWVAHPLRSARLWRWMRTWDEPSRKAAHARYMRLLYAVALAQADERVGRVPVLWRRRLPVTLRYQLSMGLLPEPVTAGEGDWQEALAEHVEGQLALLPDLPADAPEETPALAPQDTPAGLTADTTAARQPSRQKAASDDAAQLARKRARAKRLLSATPPPTLAEVAAKTGLSERTLSRIKSDLPAKPQPLHAVAGTK
jgi:hypothetical protein